MHSKLLLCLPALISVYFLKKIRFSEFIEVYLIESTQILA